MNTTTTSTVRCVTLLLISLSFDLSAATSSPPVLKLMNLTTIANDPPLIATKGGDSEASVPKETSEAPTLTKTPKEDTMETPPKPVLKPISPVDPTATEGEASITDDGEPAVLPAESIKDSEKPSSSEKTSETVNLVKEEVTMAEPIAEVQTPERALIVRLDESSLLLKKKVKRGNTKTKSDRKLKYRLKRRKAEDKKNNHVKKKCVVVGNTTFKILWSHGDYVGVVSADKKHERKLNPTVFSKLTDISVGNFIRWSEGSTKKYAMVSEIKGDKYIITMEHDGSRYNEVSQTMIEYADPKDYPMGEAWQCHYYPEDHDRYSGSKYRVISKEKLDGCKFYKTLSQAKRSTKQ